MDRQLAARAGAVFAGGFLGTGARFGVLELVDHDVVALAVVNLLGCLALGLISGAYGQRVTVLRAFLAIGGVAAFTSWSSLALQGVAGPGSVAVVVAEVAAGVAMAGLGHLVALRIRRRRDGATLAPSGVGR